MANVLQKRLVSISEPKTEMPKTYIKCLYFVDSSAGRVAEGSSASRIRTKTLR